MQISRNSETGISRGCGYVIMSSIDEAKSAVAALDGFVSWNFLCANLFSFLEFSSTFFSDVVLYICFTFLGFRWA